MAASETGAGDPSRCGSICIRRPPGRVTRLRLQFLNRLRQPHEGIGDVLSAVDLHPDRALEACELGPPGLVEVLHGLPGGLH
eukprot:3516890-Alexandrium_andersonii.AAC.1